MQTSIQIVTNKPSTASTIIIIIDEVCCLTQIAEEVRRGVTSRLVTGQGHMKQRPVVRAGLEAAWSPQDPPSPDTRHGLAGAASLSTLNTPILTIMTTTTAERCEVRGER